MVDGVWRSHTHVYVRAPQGESDGEPLLGKCCFFLRNAPPGQPIDAGKEGESVRLGCAILFFGWTGRTS